MMGGNGEDPQNLDPRYDGDEQFAAIAIATWTLASFFDPRLPSFVRGLVVGGFSRLFSFLVLRFSRNKKERFDFSFWFQL
jgi:hypothetical protein